MVSKLLLASAPLLVGLVLLGAFIDSQPALDQAALWASLQLASLGGALFALGAVLRLMPSSPRPWLVLATFFSWRVAYFPIMVFSGHVASIGEWLLSLVGLPIFVYPIFLLAVSLLHAAGAGVAALGVAAPKPFLRWGAVAAFAVAGCVSFNQPRDLLPIPDTNWTLGDAVVPEMQRESGNPYADALTAPGYWPNQRVVLLAATLTYDTIPPSPWATTVKAVLEGLFEATPFGSTRARVLEHYLAYHAAHPLIGCPELETCAAFAPEPR
jgi:hypothetical protein